MFDIGGWEFLLVAVIAIVVIGPKEASGIPTFAKNDWKP